MPPSYLCRDIYGATGNNQFEIQGRNEFGVIYIEMVFKTEEEMNAQLERCYSERKRKPRPRSWGIPQLKSSQKRKSQLHTKSGP